MNTPRMLYTSVFVTVLIALFCTPPAGADAAPAAQRDTIRVYGPGGPLPAMKEAAALFQQKTGITVLVTGGPTPQWLEQAPRRALRHLSSSRCLANDAWPSTSAGAPIRRVSRIPGGGAHLCEMGLDNYEVIFPDSPAGLNRLAFQSIQHRASALF